MPAPCARACVAECVDPRQAQRQAVAGHTIGRPAAALVAVPAAALVAVPAAAPVRLRIPLLCAARRGCRFRTRGHDHLGCDRRSAIERRQGIALQSSLYHLARVLRVGAPEQGWPRDRHQRMDAVARMEAEQARQIVPGRTADAAGARAAGRAAPDAARARTGTGRTAPVTACGRPHGACWRQPLRQRLATTPHANAVPPPARRQRSGRLSVSARGARSQRRARAARQGPPRRPERARPWRSSWTATVAGLAGPAPRGAVAPACRVAGSAGRPVRAGAR